MELLQREYYELLNRQQFNEEELDYTLLDRHKPLLEKLSTVGNSGVTVFDMHRKEHVFTSYNFESLFGYDLGEIERSGNSYFDARVHPEDLIALLQNGIALLKLFYRLSGTARAEYKLINEYRVLNAEDRYIRVIEQHQALELDARGNIWLSLGVMDLSPNQDSEPGIKSQLLNYKTGELVSFFPEEPPRKEFPETDLTKREREVLQLVKEGLLSKEISDKLYISVHTVNTHRQRILEKLGADNSMEAVSFASRLGLLA